ncbi:MAG: hypothetical protein CMK09_06090 [Ponticaulis sp.]|nr:hypothetical protein [Ponticaulis sp.]|tara:strand:+ start:3237 stop:3992 length:756 start_codon:yes stop_codon:yes gene_type:complete
MSDKIYALFAVSVLALASCATDPAPIRNGGASGQSGAGDTNFRVDPDSGPTQPANIQRLYPNARLFVCKGTRVSNAPATDSDLEVIGYSRMVVVKGPRGDVPVVTAPANNACVSSGYGMRTLGNSPTRMHNGIDIFSKPASRVFSGAAGTVLEAGYNGNYGLAVLMDHGNGVYTRYAHLNYIEDDIKPGAVLVYGHPIGLMGKSGQVTGIHLHYEILTGTYRAGVWGRGLKSHNPFDFPPWYDPRLAQLDR